MFTKSRIKTATFFLENERLFWEKTIQQINKFETLHNLKMKKTIQKKGGMMILT